MGDIRRSLEVVLKAQNDVDIERVVNEMKSTALATSNWEQLVSSAPVALQCLGACLVAADSRDLASVKVPMMPGAKVERSPDLRRNLMECSNLGTKTFIVANKSMAEIFERCTMLWRKVFEMGEALATNPRGAARFVPNLLKQFQSGATQCSDASKEIDRSFAEWLAFTSELLEACQNQSSVAVNEQQRNITDKAVAALKAKETEKIAQSTNDAMKDLGKIMDAARAAFKKASDNQPTGWDIVGQQLVSSLGQCVTTGLSLAIPALVDSMNPAAKAKTAQPTDPALAYVQKDLYLYNILKMIVQGTDGSVNWEAAKASGDKSGLSFIESMLSQSRTDLDKLTSNGTVAVKYKQILSDVIKVVSEMSKASKDAASSMSGRLPEKGSGTVVGWQTSFDTSYRSVVSLDMQAKCLPYNSQSSSPALPDNGLERAKIDYQASQTQAVLQHAAAQLETTARAMETTSKVYGETRKVLSDQQTALSDLNANLARLTSGAIKLEELKQILTFCIALILEMKARIVDLVSCFDTLTAVMKPMNENLVRNWSDTLGNPASFKIGQYSSESVERTMILNGCITIASYFSFFADVGNTWRSTSERSIFPGIQLVEMLSMSGDARSRIGQLNDWSKQGQGSIKNDFDKRREEIQSNMSDRVGEVRGVIRDLPANTVPSTITDEAGKAAGLIENAQREIVKQESDQNAIRIVTSKRG